MCNEFAHCNLLLLAQCQRHGCLEVIHDIFLFLVLGTFIGSSYRRDFRLFSFFRHRLQVYRALVDRHGTLYSQLQLSPFGCREQQWPISVAKRWSWPWVRRIEKFPLSSILITSRGEIRGRTMFKFLVADSGRLANTWSIRSFRSQIFFRCGHSLRNW